MNGKLFIIVFAIGVLGTGFNLFNSDTYEERLGWCTGFSYVVTSLLLQIELNKCKKKNDEEESE